MPDHAVPAFPTGHDGAASWSNYKAVTVDQPTPKGSPYVYAPNGTQERPRPSCSDDIAPKMNPTSTDCLHPSASSAIGANPTTQGDREFDFIRTRGTHAARLFNNEAQVDGFQAGGTSNDYFHMSNQAARIELMHPQMMRNAQALAQLESRPGLTEQYVPHQSRVLESMYTLRHTQGSRCPQSNRPLDCVTAPNSQSAQRWMTAGGVLHDSRSPPNPPNINPSASPSYTPPNATQGMPPGGSGPPSQGGDIPEQNNSGQGGCPSHPPAGQGSEADDENYRRWA